MSLIEKIPEIELIMEQHNVRGFSGAVINSAFGEAMISIRGHLNDMRFANLDKMFGALEAALHADVCLAPDEYNKILIRPRPCAPERGTVEARFEWLMWELERHFPKGTDYRKLCGEPPEVHMLREIEGELKDAAETKQLLQELFTMLNSQEESDGGSLIRPTYIASCRVMHTQRLNKILPRLEELAGYKKV